MATNKEKQQKYSEDALAFRDYLVENGLYEKLDGKSREFVAALCKQHFHLKTNPSSLLNDLFGPAPKVGDSITLEEAFAKTAKTKSALNIVFSRWEKAGGRPAKIETRPDDDMLKTRYRIASLA
jgi:hypothetical protein